MTIYTDEDDEFARIERENAMKSGQPYFFDGVYVSVSQRNQVIDEVDDIIDLEERKIKHKEIIDEYFIVQKEFNSNKVSHIQDILKISEPFKELLLKELNKLAE